MRHTVNLPKLGDMTESVVVLEWLKAVGDAVDEGEPLLTAETEKVDAEVPSPVAGTLVERLVAEGDEVPVGAPVAVIEQASGE